MDIIHIQSTYLHLFASCFQIWASSGSGQILNGLEVGIHFPPNHQTFGEALHSDTVSFPTADVGTEQPPVIGSDGDGGDNRRSVDMDKPGTSQTITDRSTANSKSPAGSSYINCNGAMKRCGGKPGETTSISRADKFSIPYRFL
jgi:hypothetical protein